MICSIEIDPRLRHQTMEGFGASGAWWAQAVGAWPEPEMTRVLRVLFDRRAGIGLTIYRYNLGGGGGEEIRDPWRRGETFADGRGGYDWSRDAAAVRVLRAACAAGAERVVAFANSPPAHLTISRRASGNVGGATNLAPEMYAAYAQYLVDVARHLREDEGVPVRWVSPVNEPQWDWNPTKGQEGAHYSPAEALEVTRALLRALRDGGPAGVRVSAPESGEWKRSEPWLDTFVEDPEVGPALDHFAVHSYWSQPADKETFARRAAERHPGLRLWMSEWTEMRGGRDFGMDSALVLADTLIDDLTIGGVTSWQYWIAVSKYNYRDGLLHVEEGGPSEAVPTRRLWALGNFSRFVRPGAVRVEARTAAPGLRVAAFAPAAGRGLVAVVVNESDEPRTAVPTIAGVAEVGVTGAWMTADGHDLAPVPTSPALVLPARSVVTLALQAPTA